MRAVLATILAVMLITPGVRAQSPDDRRQQVSAATARAVEALRAQIATEPVARNITVGDILKATDGAATLRKTLCRAQMIGGPRWIDDQTCEVQLEMTGQRVAGALLQIVDANPKKSPIAADVLSMRLRDWNNRTFSATGTSTGAAAVANVRPVADGNAWKDVTDESRQQAIAAARHNAAVAVINDIKPIKLANARTVGDVLADPQAQAAVETWLASQPVTQVEFRDDQQVRVTVATPADELFNAFRAAAKGVTLDDPTWTRVGNDFAATVAPTSRGAARAQVGAGGVKRAAFNLPGQPPQWADTQLSADGVGPAGESRLKAARAAEADAHARLRTQIDTLPLAAGMTIGAAARLDANFNDAIDRAILRARPTKVEYQNDRSARVRITLDLQTLWDEISASR